MKKIFTLLFIILITTKSQSQSVLPNPSFENWTTVGTYMVPDDWNTLNPTTSALGVLTCLKATGVDVHTGNAAIKLVTKSVFGQNANGLATTGHIVIAPPGVDGGVAYTGRPDSIAGWYKYTSVSGDNGFVEFQLLGSATAPDTIGYVRFLTPTSNVSTYTHFSVPIVYRSPNPVAKSIWIISSSAGFTASVNSTLFIDDLELITNSGVGINELTQNSFSFAPNPVQHELAIENNSAKNIFTLYDAEGKLQLQSTLVKGKNTIDFSQLANGIYFYSSYDEEKNKFQRGKIIVAH